MPPSFDEQVVQHRAGRLRTWVKRTTTRLNRAPSKEEILERLDFNWPTATDEEREAIFNGACNES